MIEQQARVIEARDGRLRVSVGAQSGCAACDSGQGCGAGIFGRLLRGRPVELDMENTAGARVGDLVTLGVREGDYLALVARFYGWPLLAGLFAALVVFQFLRGMPPSGSISPGLLDLATLAGGLSAGALTLFWVRRRLPPRLVRLTPVLLPGSRSRLDCQGRELQ